VNQDTPEIEARCEILRKKIADEKDEDKLEVLKKRLAYLSSGAGIIKVGGVSEIEMKERKDRVDDAVEAVKYALEDGLVVGGGAALLHAGKKHLTSCVVTDTAEQCGYHLVMTALSSPLKQLLANAGIEDTLPIETKILYSEHDNLGYDVFSEEIVEDMFEHGLVDPFKVTKTALESAVSVVGTLLTTEVVITEREKSNK
jgi:chaperonin GroEL